MKKYEAKRNGSTVLFQCRLSYVHLDQPWGTDDEKKKYSVSCLIPKGDESTLNAIRGAVKDATENGKAKWGGKVPGRLSTPLRDGDEEREEDAAYAGMMFLNANSQRPVPVGNRLKEPIEPTEAYSGCYALVKVSFYPYDVNGNKGIAAGLEAVIKYADGERLGGSGASLEDFGEIDIEDEDDY